MDNLEELFLQGGLGGYMDQNIDAPVPTLGRKPPSSSYGSKISEVERKTRNRLVDMKNAAWTMKQHNPQMPDHEIGRHITHLFEQQDLHDSVFGRAFEQSQINAKQTY